MRGLLLLIQFLSALVLIVAVLLHSAKGEGLGGIGGSAKLFGSPKGMEKGLDTITWGCTIVFLSVSVLLALLKF
ncbi:preprotein translocase subunit SecG [Candidatus Saganbacteria bacterium CG08_land_8_20_14_0_20_45_16]|uniref:Protein-export membrane protein SecG n=1 Tax=Candidatus Saganbacteria bacterium CG08_land_8_20_14_0_20_45_16 TaxID=2014293 RepID=A0A2H0XU90_UNCSA|nr:MAG: preprotein translocase subunit SecG [Candidatus Saganbacteria bacterium CG08_land_8_20_14_0_20_45_16]